MDRQKNPWTLQQMIKPRPGKSGQARDADDRFRVRRNTAPCEVRAKNKKSADKGDGDHQAVRAERYGANVNERIQLDSSSSP